MESKIGSYRSDKESADLLQVSVGNDIKLYDLTMKKIKEVWFLEDCERFADRENYVETGFNLVYKDENDQESIVQPNDGFTAYTIKNNQPNNKALLYKCCDEIDLHQLDNFNNCLKNN